MSIPVPRNPSHCKRCGTVVTAGLIICPICAAKYHIAPADTFARQLGVTPRPPYEQRHSPTDTSGDDT